MNDGGAGAAAVHAAIIQAIKASGAIVRVEPDDFMSLVNRQRDGLVVHATGGLLSTNYQYLLGYKGLTFYTKSPEPLPLPPSMEVVHAKSIWVPQ